MVLDELITDPGTSTTLAKKRPAHRPVTIDARRVNVTLDGETIERAKSLGGGNLSAGLREAVRIAQVKL